MKSFTCIALTVALAVFGTVAGATATKPSSFAPHWSEEAHLSSTPKRHSNHSSSHKSGHHTNPRTGNHSQPAPGSK
jgi:hypothetical protein